MPVLAVHAGPVVVLDGELGAAVQAAQAHDAALLHLDGPPAPHLEALSGHFLAQSPQPMQVSSSMKWDVLRIFSYSGRTTRDVKQGMARLVKLPCSRRSIRPMTSETLLVCLTVGLGDLVRV